MHKKILLFFDKLEDKVRKRLSYYPLLYAFIGGTGVVLFWRGIWHTADFAVEYYYSASSVSQSMGANSLIWWDGPLSIIIGLAMLLVSGIFVSSFIGNEIIISGIKGEKKLVEKTEKEMLCEVESISGIKRELDVFSKRLEKIESAINGKKL